MSLETSREYLFLSILSYYNFTEKFQGKYIKDLLEEIETFSLSSSLNIIRSDIKGKNKSFFDKEINEWKVYRVDDRTRNRKSGSGFFAVIFQKEDKYVISYRGSETYPFEEAYKDFIDTDLVIGLGKKPLQFWEGLEVFENLLKDNIPFENISITGHSLGGGIAQFVAIMSYKKYNICPYVCTWNSVGIKREGIIGIEDFIEYDKILKNCNLSEKEIKVLKEFEEDYVNFIMKELKKLRIIKDNRTVLITDKFQLTFELNQEFFHELIKQTNLNRVLKKIPLIRRRQILLNERILEKLFLRDDLYLILREAKEFINKLSENKIFNGKIINFCHSKDFVGSLFLHFGTTYQVDLNFLKKDISKNRILSNLLFFNKSIQEYHFEDVFIPLLDKKGVFTQKISEEYIASVIRKIIYLEKSFSKEFLGEYFLLRENPFENFERFLLELQRGLRNNTDNILYKEKIIEFLRKISQEDLSRIWKKVIEKLSSPYIPRDIYDLIVFKDIYSER
ncbi:lipase family protein [Fusobacterium perfoetens]|uniref:lipase family protein n=1 Tax=Fusobacterium perfoetens TaxID=852 RepID=UPI00130E15AB|nr:lipase family protein [Fusobacterium perfoetens]